MKTTLHLSSDLKLPIDAATQTFSFIGRKGSGKTYAAGKLTELLIDAGVQTIVLDSVGNWYGLRLAADGKSKGLDVPVFGGLRDDLPLQSTAGELVAGVAVESGRSMILDVSQFNLAERRRFATAFAEALWQKKKAELRPSPMFLVIEEAQLIVPEKIPKGFESMVHIFTEIIRLGRNFGIGCALITQRPQSVSKEVLNQTECLVVFQVNGAHERKALGEWIVHQGMDKGLLEELPSLAVGEGYIWSPQWLRILRKIRVAKKETFDASATPKVGETRLRRELPSLDLGKLKEQMAATIEEAKTNDPREMRKRIASLRTRIADLEKLPPKVLQGKTKEVPVLKDGQLARIEKMVNQAKDFAAKFHEESLRFHDSLSKLQPNAANWHSDAANMQRVASRHHAAPNSHPQPAPQREPVQSGQPSRAFERPAGGNGVQNVSIGSGGLKRMMVALAQCPRGLTYRQIGVRAGMSSKSGTFSNYLGKMRSNGWVEATSGGVRITDAGIEALGPYNPLPTGQALLDHWLGELGSGSGASRMLRALGEAYPNALSRDELGAAATISPGSGTFSNYLGKLRTLELVQDAGRDLRASPEFFTEASQ